jgi:hypothetical protein
VSPYYLTAGWYGLRNRLPEEQDFSSDARDRAEREEFRRREWTTLNQPEKLGVDNLRDALTAMLNTQIARSIPSLIPEIRIKIADCKSELDRLGHARVTRSQQLNCMMTLATEFSRLSTDALNGNYHTIPASQNAKIRKIYQDTLVELQRNMNQDREAIFNLDGSRDLVLLEEDSDFNPNCEHRPLPQNEGSNLYRSYICPFAVQERVRMEGKYFGARYFPGDLQYHP